MLEYDKDAMQRTPEGESVLWICRHLKDLGLGFWKSNSSREGSSEEPINE